jgi:hypothetical protein
MAKEVRIDISANANNVNNTLREVETNVDRVNSKVSTVNQTNVIGGPKNLPANQNVDVQNQILLYRQQQEQKERQIKREFSELRSENIAEFKESTHENKAGILSDKDYEETKKQFHRTQAELYAEERDEKLTEAQKTNQLIQELIDRQDKNSQDQTEALQRDNTETEGGGGAKGILRALFDKRSDLMAKRLDATSDDELRRLNKELGKTNRDIQRRGGGNGMADVVTEGGELVGSVASGSQSSIMGAGMGLLSKAGPWGIAAAAIIAAGTGITNSANARDKEISNLISYRALGGRDDINKSVMETDYSKYGATNEEFINKRKELLLAAGNPYAGGTKNYQDVMNLERGYGVNSIANLSTFERQDKYLKSTSENIIEMINVLTSIKNGSLKKEDFTLLNEKSQLMYRLQTSQVTRQEQFDNKQILGLMTAFEKMGGEGKDFRAGEFIEGTLQSMREGGSKNMMLLKTKFAIDAHPNLANDPAALSRMIEEGTDPKYIASTLAGLKNIAGGNKQNEYFLSKEFFGPNGLTPSMREKLMKGGGDKEILDNIRGVGLTSTTVASQIDAEKYAYEKTTGVEEFFGDLKKGINTINLNLKEQFNALFGTGSVPVSLVNKDLSNIKSTTPINTVPGK